MNEKQYLEHMVEALTDGVSITCEDACGGCHKQRINGKLAKRLLKYEIKVTLAQYNQMCDRVWRYSKYVKFYEAQIATGKSLEDALEAMKEKGWQP